MKRLLIVLGFLILSSSAFGQIKPLTQPEFVKMLYAFDKDTSAKTDLIEAVRTRGIGFLLTDGLRSLTRTKSKNDEEVKRVVEEAERRRKEPAAFQRPTASEAAEALKNARERTLAAVEEMPDFVVKQLIQRAIAYSGTGTFQNLDRLVVGVSYRATGEEEYRVLSVNGAVQNNADSKRSYEEVGGTSSTGEFVTVLATIFKTESNTKFDVVDSDVIRGRKAITFDFAVEAGKARQTITCTGITPQTAITGIKGRVWIDRENFRVLRVESEATDIPAAFPCTSARRNIDYDWTTISEEKFLLPLVSDVRLTFRDKSRLLESRNVIRFREYQKYGTDVKVVEGEDDVVVEDEKP
jgi:hypothetical protein